MARLIGFILCACIAHGGCAKSDVHSSYVMGTVVTAQGTKSVPLSNEDMQLILKIFHDVDNAMSEWKPKSPLSTVNEAAGSHPVQVPSDLFIAVARALEIAELTSGAFDPTWAALWELWDFSITPEITHRVPTQDQVSELLPMVNWEVVHMDAQLQTILLPEEGMALGLGGIAKGIALEVAKTALHQHGVENFILVAGGQVLVSGTNEALPWRVGIRKPDGATDEFLAVLDVTDTCVSTSGDYENYFEVDGTRYHHIIDPRTGYPATGCSSVTVISPDATLADALSTALFVMGPDLAMQFVENLPNVDAIIIDSDGQILKSSNIMDKFTLIEG